MVRRPDFHSGNQSSILCSATNFSLEFQMDVLEKEEIFNDIYKRKINAVKWKFRHNATDHEAEELAHDVFLKLYKNMDRFRNEASIDTWLFAITKNMYCNFIIQKYGKKRN